MKHNSTIQSIEESLKYKSPITQDDLNQYTIQKGADKEKDLIHYLQVANNTTSKEDKELSIKALGKKVKETGKDLREIDKLTAEFELIIKEICKNGMIEQCKDKNVVKGGNDNVEQNVDFIDKLIEKIDNIKEYDKTIEIEVSESENKLQEITGSRDEFYSGNNYIEIDNYNQKGKKRKIKLDNGGAGDELIAYLKQVKNIDFVKFKEYRSKQITDLETDINKLIEIVNGSIAFIGKAQAKSLKEDLKTKLKTVLKKIKDDLNDTDKKLKNIVKYLEIATSKFSEKLKQIKADNEAKLRNQRNNDNRYYRNINDNKELERRRIIDDLVDTLRQHEGNINEYVYSNSNSNSNSNELRDLNNIINNSNDSNDSTFNSIIDNLKKYNIETDDKLQKVKYKVDLLIDNVERYIKGQEEKQRNQPQPQPPPPGSTQTPSNEKELTELDDLKELVVKIQSVYKRIVNSDGITGKASKLMGVGDDIFKLLLDDYEEKRSAALKMEDKIEVDKEFLKKIDSYGLNFREVFRVNDNDKLFFVMLILVVQLISFSIVEILIENDYVDNLLSSITVYGIVYSLIMGGIIFGVNSLGYKLKLVFNYLNTDFNISQIIVHFSIIAVFLIIIGIVSMNVNTYVVNDRDGEEKIKLMYRIDMISSVITIFTAMFVFLL
jgi:hypothetical protein